MPSSERPSRIPHAFPRRRPKLNKRKAPVPAGRRSLFSKGKPCFAFFRAPVAHTPRLPAQAAQIKLKKSPRARRAQKLILRGQALLYFFRAPVAHTPRLPAQAAQTK
ncbi:hypothetical protein KL86DES1_20427 [uncultured Desulfovibrio sp.]|uniref:Uncharacterized protein n=1 Tax=uncultured Desulfovibrio sp. TaxID=167968 RepID=A0A212L3N1_9BACT|nr:hypothetical protein KL86DES1_20427 [uncultured Desulfovibrio sp.]VZH33330.1 conserved protein of unknown function [Desulfovibrio sp. 86]